MNDDDPQWMTAPTGISPVELRPQPERVAEGFDGGARWLGRPAPDTPSQFGSQPAAPLLRRRFEVAAPVRSAVLRVAAFGLFEAEINGAKVGDAVLDPPPSQFNRTVFSRTHDVAPLLTIGGNVLGLIVGRGFASGVSGPSSAWSAEPSVLVQLNVELVDGRTLRIVSDEQWETCDSAVHDWLFYGETFDARVADPAWSTSAARPDVWQPAATRPWPTARVVPATVPPVKVMDELQPVAVAHPTPTSKVFDFGKTTAGVARLSASGTAGTELEIRYGQQLDAEGHVALFAPRLNVDHLVLSGDGRDVWTPRFTRHPFQYVEVVAPTDDPGAATGSDAVALESYTAVEPSGTFTCSNPVLNRIHTNQQRSLVMNHWGYPTDCAGRDRQGWTADAACFLDGAILNFRGFAPLYDDWLLTLRDTEQADGSLSIFAPDGYEVPVFNDPSWSGMIVLIPWALYRYSGDTGVLRTNYEAMCRWMDLMDATISGTGDLYEGFSFGDHSPPGVGLDGSVDISPPEGSEVTRNAHLHEEARTLSEISSILGHDERAARYRAVAERIRAAFHPAFFTGDEYRTSIQDEYRQTPNIVALAFGLVPPEYVRPVFDRLVQDLEDRGARLNTGAIGTKRLLPLLTDFGRGDLAYRIAAQTAFPSWGYWVTKGATSSWETWDNYGPEQTLDHPFLGTAEEWFYEHLAGVQPADPGYGRTRVAPLFPDELDSVSASVGTPHGTVSSAWTRSDGIVELRVRVPSGIASEIVLPYPRGAVTIAAGAASVSVATEASTVLVVESDEVVVIIS